MKNIKAVRALLWTMNFIILLFLIVFAFNKILFPSLEGGTDDADQSASVQPPPVHVDHERFKYVTYQVVWALPNPMEKKKIEKPPGGDGPPARPLSSFVTVIGVNPNRNYPEKASAVIKVDNTVYVTAYVGKPILNDDGKIVPSLNNYRLVEVHRDRIVFERDGRHREELVIEAPLSAQSFAGEAGAPASSNKSMVNPQASPNPSGPMPSFTSQMTVDTPERKVWAIDTNERDWAIQNQEALLGNDVTISPYASGGIKVDTIREGSIVASRGLQVGDVVKSINGKEVKSLAEARNLMNDPVVRNSNVLIVIVNRAGRLVTLEYGLKK